MTDSNKPRPSHITTPLGRNISRTFGQDDQGNPTVSYDVGGQQGVVTSNQLRENTGQGSFNVMPSSGVLSMMAGRVPEQAPEQAQRQRQRSNPMDQFRREQMANYRTLNEQLIRGMNSTSAGRRLTADGFNALAGKMRHISEGLGGAEQAQLRNETDLARQGLVNQGRLDERQLMGEQDLQRTQLQGDLTSQQARENAWLNVWKGEQTGDNEYNRRRAQILGEVGVTPIAPREIRDANGIVTGHDYGFADLANSAMTDFLADNGYDPNATIAAVREEIDGLRDLKDAESVAMKEVLDAVLGQLGRHGQRENFLDGGLVMGDEYMQSFADGGLVMPPNESPDMLPQQASPAAQPMMGGMVMQQYQKYIELARKSGIEPLGFEEFVQLQMSQSGEPGGGMPAMPEMQQGAMGSQDIIGMADGGMVPDMGGALSQAAGPQVDGKMVIDDDPFAGEDSIPAMIDGQHPAALDSGEMVIPKDVVLFYGTQKLQQMIEKARQGANPQ